MTPVSPIDEIALRTICGIIGDTSEGLSGSEIGQFLQSCDIDDPFPNATKRDRLYEALNQRQKRDKSGNQVISFIYKVMNPVRYTRTPDIFEKRRFELNKALAFIGMNIGEDGKIITVDIARTINEANERAGRLYKELLQRKAHPDVLRFCKSELLQENYFHAVFEATKSIADKIREKSGFTSDGSQLVDEAFGGKAPVLAFNSLRTDTEHSEHTGLMNLLKGLFGTFRNTTAHAPKIKWVIVEQDAIDMLTFTSLLHRRLDNCVRTNITP
jgi:uncharacterized protein (TIGR02391 family)